MDDVTGSYLRNQLLVRRQRLESAVFGVTDTAPLLRLMEQVDSALREMDSGTFGLCDVCHDPVEVDRLVADPLLRTCLDHLTAQQKRDFEMDLVLAAKIQEELLPRQEMTHGIWETAYHYEGLAAVSGDYCDIISSGPSEMLFLLGDVSGKGVAASILMSHLHAIFRSLMTVGLTFDQLIERANRVFCESTPSSTFATLVCGKAGQGGELEICNAGHCTPLRISSTDITPLDSTGLPLGMFCSSPYGVQKTRLERGDCLLLYTDGLTEARNHSNEEYGMERLTSAVRTHRGLSAHNLVNQCIRDLNQFLSGAAKNDDMTVMVIRRIE